MKTEIDALIGLIDGKLSTDEKRAVEELHQYMLGDEGSWALSDGFLDFVGKFFLLLFTLQMSALHVYNIIYIYTNFRDISTVSVLSHKA